MTDTKKKVVKKKATATKKATTKKPAVRTKANAAKNAKKKVCDNVREAVNQTRQPLDEFSSDCLFHYGSYVVEDRSVPDFRDGLKPVHRAILWSMYELGLHKKGAKHKKSARVVGDALGKYHPHGDTACYGAAVTLANANTPLIDGKGNWGTPVDPAAAMRYTEARIDRFASTFLLNPSYLEVVPRDPNYDGSESIPRYLPALLPTMLLLGNPRVPAFGVSVGNPSFALDGIVNLVCKGLSGKKITDKDCVENLVVEYESGCENVTPMGTYEEFVETGKGSLTTRPHIVANWEKKRIIVLSYSPSFNSVTTVAKKFDAIADLQQVSLVTAASKDFKEAVMEIRPTRGLSEDDFFTLAEKVEKMLTAKDPYELGFVFRRTEEETTFHKTNYAKLLNNWCVYRVKLEEAYLDNLITHQDKKQARIEMLIFAVNNRKVIIQALDSKDPDAFLVKKLKITSDYAKLILDLQVRKLAKLELVDLKKELTTIKDEIKRLQKERKQSGKHAAKTTKQMVKAFLKN